jgi:flagellar hook-associated protein 2
MYRSRNTIEEITSGVTLRFKEEGKTTISVTQDTEDIKKTMDSFVEQYNALSLQLTDLTKYDSDTGSVGIFQGENSIKSIMNDINAQLFSLNEDGVSIVDYGLSLTQDGLINFNEDTFSTKLSSSPKELEKLFRGGTQYNTTTVNGTAISAGSIELQEGDFTINGVSIILEATDAGNSAKQNAILLRKAINEIGFSSITATLDADETSIILSGFSSQDIDIDGDNTAVSGLSKGTTKGTSETFTGAFESTDKFLKSLFVSTDSFLTIFSNQLDSKYDTLVDYKKKEEDRLTSKYETMSAQFAAYDAIISKMNASFQSMQIDAESSSK